MNEHKKNVNRSLLIAVGTAVVILLLLILGLSRAWYVNRANIATLVEVAPPSPISIRGTHGYTIDNLDLSYNENERDANGKVTIRRVISIATDEEKHRLEIAHTTNLKNFEFKVYAATEDTSGSVSETARGETYTYKYNKDAPLAGSYLNAANNGALDSNGYRKATSDYGGNFNTEDKTQAHAVPVYWLASGDLGGTEIQEGNPTLYAQVGTKYLSYYVVEMSWQEETKETDMFYVLAENAT